MLIYVSYWCFLFWKVVLYYYCLMIYNRNKEERIMYKVIVAVKGKIIKIVEKELCLLKDNEVWLKMEVCGVCYMDLYVKNVDFGDVSGCILGYEGIGIVMEVGKDVISLKIGDCVFVVWFYEGCGYCEYCIFGWEMFCCLVKNVGYIVDGVMVEECIVIDGYVVKVLENLVLELVFFIICVGVIIYKVIKEFGICLG